MITMDEIQQRWKDGYLEGWTDQSALPTPPMPTIPPFPGGIPPGHHDPGQYAYDEGHKAGHLARLREQAGVRIHGVAAPAMPGGRPARRDEDKA